MKREEILEYAILVIFLYFLFKYYLANRNNWKIIKKYILKKLVRNKAFQKYANGLADNHIKTS